MKKIEMPNWPLVVCGYSWVENLRAWFDENIEGKYLVDKSDLVEVFSYKYTDDSNGNWSEKYDLLEDTHKAYLIKSSIEPIKKESPADILKDLVNWLDQGSLSKHDNLYLRAKAALECERE